jgi:hypothetical protein
MTRSIPMAFAAVLALCATLRAQPPDRALLDAMRNVYRLSSYTAFDWVSFVA